MYASLTHTCAHVPTLLCTHPPSCPFCPTIPLTHVHTSCPSHTFHTLFHLFTHMHTPHTPTPTHTSKHTHTHTNSHSHSYTHTLTHTLAHTQVVSSLLSLEGDLWFVGNRRHEEGFSGTLYLSSFGQLQLHSGTNITFINNTGRCVCVCVCVCVCACLHARICGVVCV